jgi:hypothetical protein
MAILRSAIRILQIGSYCRYDLSLSPNLPQNVVDFVKDNVNSLNIHSSTFPI